MPAGNRALWLTNVVTQVSNAGNLQYRVFAHLHGCRDECAHGLAEGQDRKRAVWILKQRAQAGGIGCHRGTKDLLKQRVLHLQVEHVFAARVAVGRPAAAAAAAAVAPGQNPTGPRRCPTLCLMSAGTRIVAREGLASVRQKGASGARLKRPAVPAESSADDCSSNKSREAANMPPLAS